MFCKKCGNEIVEGTICRNCGYDMNGTVVKESSNMYYEQPKNLSFIVEPEVKNTNSVVTTSTNDKKLSGWLWPAIVSALCSLVTLFKGINKMVSYSSGDHYPYKSVNAYVGGDAYNYIINGTYATAFFVLTTMFVLAAIGFVIIHYVSIASKKG